MTHTIAPSHDRYCGKCFVNGRHTLLHDLGRAYWCPWCQHEVHARKTFEHDSILTIKGRQSVTMVSHPQVVTFGGKAVT